MSNVMGICAGLVGPKSGNVEIRSVLKAFLKERRVIQEHEQLSEPGVFGVTLGLDWRHFWGICST